MEMKKAAIVGAGTMGHSIAISMAWGGVETTVIGINNEDIERAREGLLHKCSTLTKYGVISEEERRMIEGRIFLSVSLEEAVDGAGFVIEAVPENLELKQEMFQRLDALCGRETVIASTTSGLSPTKLAERTRHPERIIVTHFFNPAHLVPLVEVVKGEKTSSQTVDRTIGLMKAINKKPVLVKKDIPGFIVNRLQFALFREAQHILELGAATKEDIDAAVMYSIARRLPVTGVFLSADMGGLDVYDAISSYLFADLSNAENSLETMKKLVEKGAYGQKSGEGFYRWPKAFSEQMEKEREQLLIDFLKEDLDKKGE